MINTKLKNILLNATVTSVFLLETACGGGDHANTASTVNTKVYGCDSSIVSIMATMSTPNLLGLGEPDTTTYSTTGQNHLMIYDFHLERERITFEWNVNYCRETVETGL